MIHFITGLPRTGSTLLGAILRQNPRFHASMSGPVFDMVQGMLRSLSSSEFGMFATDVSRAGAIRAAVDVYYRHIEASVVFDTSRGWSLLAPLIYELFPESRMICMLRNPAEILDSFERRVQEQPLIQSKMYTPDCYNVYHRTDSLMKGTVGQSLNAVKQLWFGRHTSRLIAMQYDSLAADPAGVISRLYEFLGEPAFDHDFSNVEFDAPEFDAKINMPGLHSIAGPVQPRERLRVLPDDIFKMHDRCFWESNPRGIPIL